MVIENKLVWDSNFFEFDVYKLFLDENNHLLNLNALKFPAFYYIFSKKKYDYLNNFFISTQVCYSKFITQRNITDSQISYFTGQIDNKLKTLAYSAGRYSRFFKDSVLNKKFFELYNIWLVNSVNKSFADAFFIIKKNEEIAGFITVKLEKSCGIIGLIAVDDQYKGEGFGKRLMQMAENFVLENHLNVLKVATQKENQLACQFYEYLGFKIESLDYVYHIKRSNENSLQ